MAVAVGDRTIEFLLQAHAAGLSVGTTTSRSSSMISTAAATAAHASTGTSSAAAPRAAAIPHRMIAISFLVTDSTSSGRTAQVRQQAQAVPDHQRHQPRLQRGGGHRADQPVEAPPDRVATATLKAQPDDRW